MTHNHDVTNENERKTLIVIIVTFITMFAEIFYGYVTHSMALLADGYHMGTHALALSLTFIAYVLIRKLKDSPKFPSGTDKIGTLTAYTSSIFLGLTGIWIILEAIERLINTLKIQFNEAIIIAVIGFIVNAVCIVIMENHGHHHEHSHEHHNEHHHEHDEHHEDYNFKAAYYHILADALTSVLAIMALLVGKYFNIIYVDSLVGILGGILILRWAAGLIKNTVKILIGMKI